MAITRPIITKARPPFISSLTLKGSDEAFVPLPPAVEQASLDAYPDLAHQFGITEPIQGYLHADRFPLPDTRDREHYHGDAHASYWLSGLSDFLRLRATTEKAGVSMEDARYFELGCGSGRVVRHVACHSGADTWCCDLNLRHAEWIRAFLPTRIKVFHNHALPHLPLPNNHFDIVSAFSVFTHIDDFEFAWLLELRRILRPGGIAYITFQSERTWDTYKQNWIRDQLMPLRNQITEFNVCEELLAGPLPKEKTVLWWPAHDVYNSIVFHSTRYIQREWGRFFEILEIEQQGHVYQDVVVLRRST